MYGLAQKQKGFTIVELLIVIVVIAILAAVTIVSYNGIQAKALEATAKTDLSNLGKQLEIFQVENGRYPLIIPTPTTAPELEEVIRGASLYRVTRAAADGSHSGEKNFIFCTNPDKSLVIIVAIKPIVNSLDSAHPELSNGKKLLYYRTDTGMGQSVFQYTPGISSMAVNVCKSIEPSYDSTASWVLRWSFDVPTPKAQ